MGKEDRLPRSFCGTLHVQYCTERHGFVEGHWNSTGRSAGSLTLSEAETSSEPKERATVLNLTLGT